MDYEASLDTTVTFFPLLKSLVSSQLVAFPLRPSSSHHYLPGTGHQEDGQEECHCPQLAISGDPWLHLCYMLRQDRNTNYKPDVSLQGKMW